ncbi:NUDIX hydrolase [Homoserinibacter sp. YIM 151385]|uniref:NUDIX hydrolase n=1 Tax=Homoserinibacter sp. YIM 151385 TaxID=2985506 RepID=UPI0022F08290|nr:NUDIX domain-containing protein [Homoserinibacter sp. YIM 151385]WBU38578.1 NUDIX domain-containing protein [Homoserinibacter sp. YIM 151385]
MAESRDDAPAPLRIAAAIIEGEDGRLLFVRKRGTTAFMQPGGKLEPEETADETLARELEEELGLDVSPAQLRYVGRFSAPAANEPGLEVDAEVYDAPLTGRPAVAAEIEELAWVEPTALEGIDVAPLSRDILVPLILARRRS